MTTTDGQAEVKLRATTDDENILQPPRRAGLEEQETRIGVERPVDNPVPLDDAPAAPLTTPDETKGG